MSKLISVIIMSSAPSGYRRAGIALDNGVNKASVTAKELQQLEDDSRLNVQPDTQSEPDKEPVKSVEVKSPAKKKKPSKPAEVKKPAEAVKAATKPAVTKPEVNK